MPTTFFIARRYLFSKKSHNAINWVSGISMAGVAVATAAMICVLSVFNGFSDFVATLFTAFDPEVRVELTEGKTIDAGDSVLQTLRTSPHVAVYTEVLEERALLRYADRQMVVTIKGVSDNFVQLTDINHILLPHGSTLTLRETFDDPIDNLNPLDPLDNLDNLNNLDNLDADTTPIYYCVPGIGVASHLSVPVLYDEPMQVWAPKHGRRINMVNPQSSFRHGDIYSSGMVFSVRQTKYDDDVVLTSIDFARQVFDNDGRLSHVELRLTDGSTIDDVRALLDSRFRALDRFEQQADSFRVMNIEKLIAYIFLTFILLIAAFNIISSLSMLILEKRADAQTLRAMGASDSTVRRIFATEGRLISMLGAAIGMVVGLALCWAQTEFGLISLGATEGSFIVDAYPVKVQLTDVLLVFATVVAVSWLTVLWPTHKIS